MPEYKIVLTWEAVYDITDIADYIEAEFGQKRADKFQKDIKAEISKLVYMGDIFYKTQIFYRGYSIHKKPFPPSIIFYIVKEDEVHILRVLREERNWEQMLAKKLEYTYPDEE